MSPSLGPTMTETALITFFTPLKYSGIKVLSFVMSPITLVSAKWLVGRKVIEGKENLSVSIQYNIRNHNVYKAYLALMNIVIFYQLVFETSVNRSYKNW